MALPALAIGALKAGGVALGGLTLYDFLERRSGLGDAMPIALERAAVARSQAELLGLELDEGFTRGLLGLERARSREGRGLGAASEFSEIAYMVQRQRDLEMLQQKSTPGPLEMVAAAREVMLL